MPPVLHPLPRREAVIREQFRTVGLSLRREAILAGGALAAFTAWFAALRLNGSFRGVMELVPGAMMPFVMLSLFAALAVWKWEDPSRRGYHWSMPVDHASHALVKSGAGLAWLLAAGGVYLAWLMGMTLLTGGSFGMEHRLMYGSHALVEVAPWRWAVPFVGATVLYGFGTALALASRHPWRWLAGGAVAYAFLNAWTAAMNAGTPLHDVVETLWEGRYGLWTVISGLSPTGHEEYSWTYFPRFGTWTTASGLWLGAAAAAVLAAARRQPRG